MTQDQFLELLTDWLRANKQASVSLQITPETELLGSGLLDSFDFLDLIMHIESKTGRKIDLSIADPNQFSSARGLWNLAMQGETSDGNDTHGAVGRNAVHEAGAGV
jgi:acyl carrier protein